MLFLRTGKKEGRVHYAAERALTLVVMCRGVTFR